MRCFEVEMFLCGSENFCIKQGNEEALYYFKDLNKVGQLI